MARRLSECLAGFALLLSACAARPADALAPGPDVAETAAPLVDVTLTPQGDHLNAEWVLPAPVTLFRFTDDEMSVPERAAEWTVDESVFDFNGFELSRKDGAAFDSFSVTLLPAQAFYDRFYVPVVRIGDAGWNIYAAAFSPKDENVRIRFAGLADDDIVYAHGDRLPIETHLTASDSEMIYFGPAVNVKEGAATLVAGSDVPRWLSETLIRETNATAAHLANRFGGMPEEPPVIIMTYSPEGSGYTYKGGVVGRFITFDLRGMNPDPDNEDFTGNLTNLALHETAHAWLGHMYRSTENNTQSWVEEGAAEYIANRLWMSPERFRAAADEALNRCRSLLGDASLWDTETASRGQAPYKCGFLVQMIAEAAAKQQGSGDILDIWRTVFERTGETREFDTDDFLAAAGDFGGEAFTTRIVQLRTGLTPEGWDRFIQSLSDIGIETGSSETGQPPPDNRGLPVEILKALLLDECTGGYSIYGEPEDYFIEMGEQCPAPLSANPKVAGINGHSLIEASGIAYEAVRMACADGEPLVLKQLDGPDLAPLACGPHLKALPAIAGLVSLPDFAPL